MKIFGVGLSRRVCLTVNLLKFAQLISLNTLMRAE